MLSPNHESLNMHPPEGQLQQLFEAFQSGKTSDAEELAQMLIRKFPKHQFGWKVLGALYSNQGKNVDALKANKMSAKLHPSDAEAHHNLGLSLAALNRLEEAELSYLKAIALKPTYAEALNNIGITLRQLKRMDEAEEALTKAIKNKPDYSIAHCNLGNTLKDLGRLNEAILCYCRSIELNPKDAITHNNLGNTLKELGRLEESTISYRNAVAIAPDLAEAHNNLGTVLWEFNEEEAELCYQRAITLDPNFAPAYSNLGNMLSDMGRFEEAESAHRNAISINPEYTEAHNNLGATLQRQRRFDEAEVHFRRAIFLRRNFGLAHLNLGRLLYGQGDKESGIQSIEAALSIDPSSREAKLLLELLNARRARENNYKAFSGLKLQEPEFELTKNPFITYRKVDPELIAELSSINARTMEKALDTPVFGNGTCSLNYDMFDTERPALLAAKKDLTNIMRAAVGTEVYISESFFNIYRSDSGIREHDHLNELDQDEQLNLKVQKFSLAYYVTVGDQNCTEPGYLRLLDPGETVLPTEGMIVIFPADRKHSAVYNGTKERMMIGINFYAL